MRPDANAQRFFGVVAALVPAGLALHLVLSATADGGSFGSVRGSFVQDVLGHDYYAYPFMNAQVLGYATALFRCALVALLFLGLAYGALAVDRRLPGLRTETS